MASTSNPLQIVDDDDEFDWEAAVKEIDVACATTASNLIPSFSSNPALEMRKKGKFYVKSNSVSSSRQTTLDRFIGVSLECSNVFQENNRNGIGIGYKSGDIADCEDIEMLNGAVKIDPEAAKTWIYPVNVPLRHYQFSITQTALFSYTLVVLPAGLGKTLIAAVVMYNFFRWFPEGKIVFAAPSRPLVTQQIEACHKIVGIPQEWTIDLTGQIQSGRFLNLCNLLLESIYKIGRFLFHRAYLSLKVYENIGIGRTIFKLYNLPFFIFFNLKRMLCSG